MRSKIPSLPWSQQVAGSQRKLKVQMWPSDGDYLQCNELQLLRTVHTLIIVFLCCSFSRKFRGFLEMSTVFDHRGLGAWRNFAGPGLLLTAKMAHRNDVITSSDICAINSRLVMGARSGSTNVLLRACRRSPCLRCCCTAVARVGPVPHQSRLLRVTNAVLVTFFHAFPHSRPKGDKIALLAY